MLKFILAIKFVTIFAQTNLLYYELEKIPITRRRKIIETIFVSLLSTAAVALIGDFTLSPLVGLAFVAIISIYHSRTKHQTVITSIFCILSLYAISTVISALASDAIMLSLFFIQSGYNKEFIAICAIVLRLIAFGVVLKFSFPKSTNRTTAKHFSKRFNLISSGICITLFSMIAIVKIDHSILAEYAEVIIVGYSALVVIIAAIRMTEVRENEINKELERREAVHRDHQEKEILPAISVSFVKMRMALSEYDTELAESFAPDETEILQLAGERAEEIRDRLINGYVPPETGSSTLNNTLQTHAAMAAKDHVFYRVVVFTTVEPLLRFMKLREVVRLVGDLSRNAIRAAAAAANGHGAVEVYLGLNEYGDYEICIYDNGPDFPPHILAALGEYGNTTKGKDHGFGLADTLKLLDDYGGDFRVEKLEGDPEFTKCVRVTLPKKRFQKKSRGGAVLAIK
ncbi:ATP-binding protein [Acetanaerobacterium sp. MSJ-12]|uniref:ATP-binding protein n=1 Tax=Acetanaerobacterium sp. MSJ-12 TaxID=2841535 RepID=UPI001C0EDB13|nr:ATP-binding protein [Acetanaerobacterium sp. MSJ-12]MBU5419897.1 ATP-binding protein [Acetanaerobacterium sp. MSJ-12]